MPRRRGASALKFGIGSVSVRPCLARLASAVHLALWRPRTPLASRSPSSPLQIRIEPVSAASVRLTYPDPVPRVRPTGPALDDSQIRNAVRSLVRRTGESTPLVLDEVELRLGAARVDLLVVDHCLHGYELKSDRDTLRRLVTQAPAFSRTLERVTLVLALRHFTSRLLVLPRWWGLITATVVENVVELETVRAPRPNPQLDAYGLAHLLRRAEALAVLRSLGADRGVLSKPRSAIYRRLAEVQSAPELADAVRHQLRARPPRAESWDRTNARW